MQTQLPHNTPSLNALPNGWTQLSFTLSVPFRLSIGARLSWGGETLAPWRIHDAQVDCLCMNSVTDPVLDAAITLTHEGSALSHLNTEQPLLITGEDLGIADALLACAHFKTLAGKSLVLLSAERFPCMVKPAKFLVETFPNAIAACPLLEDWGFANRLVNNELPGCIEDNLDKLIQLPYFSSFNLLQFKH